ncbi:MAG: SAM-dependent methyltransferase [Leptolyngbyaceae cyanobacterium CSU_1_4]|nr:SAM-dependent methyltransferase [Leptolyngbyaceae cyanobacterium CSU_1_4]
MGLTLEQVVPWGRSLEEYIEMFDLIPTDRPRHTLDCAGGPASFNAEMTSSGHSVISCDPIYQFSVADIEQRIQDTWAILKDKVTAHQNDYIWNRFASPEALGATRLESMRKFLQDFPEGLKAGRYAAHELPVLPFQESQFDLALCSHFLLTYSDHLSEQFHLDSVQELCRVAAEVRIFPLLKVSGEPSPYLPAVIAQMQRLGYKAEVKPVPYEFQKGANQMLKICR